MRTGRVLAVVVGLVGVFGVAAAFAASGGVSWGKAIEVPGTAALNTGGNAAVLAVSCASAGNCAAGGSYTSKSAGGQAFVVSEKNGVWRKAIEVPRTGALNTGGFAQVSSVSCASAGNCAAGGQYNAGSNPQAFVVSEKSGVWGKAIEVPGTAALNTGGFAHVSSVSCVSAGNCAAGGVYSDASSGGQVFVVTEKNGVWGTAIEVPGTGALNTGGNADLNSVSCASAGNCAAGGHYSDGSGNSQAFVVSEKNGAWGTAIEVPRTGTLNTGGFANVNSVSCASAGNCAAGGVYQTDTDHAQAFVVSEKNGVWGKAIEVPGTAALNTAGGASVGAVSCASAGNCAAGGLYHTGTNHAQAFVVSEKNGVWGKAIEVPGIATLNTGGFAAVTPTSVSCVSAGNCAAGGFYSKGSKTEQAFVVGEKNGVWGAAIEVPGTAALNTAGNAGVNSISCAGTGKCAIGGSYRGSGRQSAFVTTP